MFRIYLEYTHTSVSDIILNLYWADADSLILNVYPNVLSSLGARSSFDLFARFSYFLISGFLHQATDPYYRQLSFSSPVNFVFEPSRSRQG